MTLALALACAALKAQVPADSIPTDTAAALVPDTAKADTAKVRVKEPIYYGMNVRLDVGNTLMELARSQGEVQQVEAALNVNLQQRFYPTLELGYQRAGNQETPRGLYTTQGAFTRIGLDFNPLRKNRNSDYFLTVGLRAGLALQDWAQVMRFDSWGEILGGLQVKVAGPLTMGWAVRYRFLFTETEEMPRYIPGFGKASGGFGFNYYLGFRI